MDIHKGVTKVRCYARSEMATQHLSNLTINSEGFRLIWSYKLEIFCS